MDKKPGISVCFVIKNGVKQGYPFWESLKSCLDFADEIVISEGHSTDGTMDYIKRFTNKYSDRCRFRIYTDDWASFKTSSGEVIALVSDRNMRRCDYEWVYYLQADEIIHPDNVQFLRDVAMPGSKYNSVMFPFYHFINSWTPVPKGKVAYDNAIRMIRNRKDIMPIGDAWTFGGNINPMHHPDTVPKPIYHLGWVFPKNIDIKHVEHEKLYPDMEGYKNSANAARSRMADANYNPMPKSDTFDDYPPGVERLFGMIQYELPEEAML